MKSPTSRHDRPIVCVDVCNVRVYDAARIIRSNGGRSCEVRARRPCRVPAPSSRRPVGIREERRWRWKERARAKRSLGQGRWQLGVNGQAAPARSYVGCAREIVGQVVLAGRQGKRKNKRRRGGRGERKTRSTREKPFSRYAFGRQARPGERGTGYKFLFLPQRGYSRAYDLRARAREGSLIDATAARIRDINPRARFTRLKLIALPRTWPYKRDIANHRRIVNNVHFFRTSARGPARGCGFNVVTASCPIYLTGRLSSASPSFSVFFFA